MANTGTIELRIEVDTRDGSARIRKFGTDTEDSMRKAEKSASAFSGTVGSMVKAIGGLAAAYVSFQTLQAAITETVRIGAEFEQTMATVGGVMRATSDDFARLEAAAKKAGAETEWSATQSAEALKYMGMAGFNAGQAVEALPGLLDLATAGQLDLGTAADIATDSLTAMGMGVSELTRFNDVLVGTITRTNTDIQKMGESLKYVAPVAHNFGLDIETTSALLGTMANAGIKASDAGTDLRQALMRTADAAKALGIEGASFTEVLKAAKEAQWDANKVNEEFGMIASKSVLVLMENIDAYEKLNTELRGVDGESKRLADTMRDTVAGSFKGLQSAVESVALEAFDMYKGSLKEAIVDTTQFVRDHKDTILAVVSALEIAAQAVTAYVAVMVTLKGVTIASTAAVTAYNVAMELVATYTTSAATITEVLNARLQTTSVSAQLAAGSLTKVQLALGVIGAAIAGLAMTL